MRAACASLYGSLCISTKRLSARRIALANAISCSAESAKRETFFCPVPWPTCPHRNKQHSSLRAGELVAPPLQLPRQRAASPFGVSEVRAPAARRGAAGAQHRYLRTCGPAAPRASRTVTVASVDARRTAAAETGAIWCSHTWAHIHMCARRKLHDSCRIAARMRHMGVMACCAAIPPQVPHLPRGIPPAR